MAVDLIRAQKMAHHGYYGGKNAHFRLSKVLHSLKKTIDALVFRIFHFGPIDPKKISTRKFQWLSAATVSKFDPSHLTEKQLRKLIPAHAKVLKKKFDQKGVSKLGFAALVEIIQSDRELFQRNILPHLSSGQWCALYCWADDLKAKEAFNLLQQTPIVDSGSLKLTTDYFPLKKSLVTDAMTRHLPDAEVYPLFPDYTTVIKRADAAGEPISIPDGALEHVLPSFQKASEEEKLKLLLHDKVSDQAKSKLVTAWFQKDPSAVCSLEMYEKILQPFGFLVADPKHTDLNGIIGTHNSDLLTKPSAEVVFSAVEDFSSGSFPEWISLLIKRKSVPYFFIQLETKTIVPSMPLMDERFAFGLKRSIPVITDYFKSSVVYMQWVKENTPAGKECVIQTHKIQCGSLKHSPQVSILTQRLAAEFVGVKIIFDDLTQLEIEEATNRWKALNLSNKSVLQCIEALHESLLPTNPLPCIPNDFGKLIEDCLFDKRPGLTAMQKLKVDSEPLALLNRISPAPEICVFLDQLYHSIKLMKLSLYFSMAKLNSKVDLRVGSKFSEIVLGFALLRDELNSLQCSASPGMSSTGSFHSSFKELVEKSKQAKRANIREEAFHLNVKNRYDISLDTKRKCSSEAKKSLSNIFDLVENVLQKLPNSEEYQVITSSLHTLRQILQEGEKLFELLLEKVELEKKSLGEKGLLECEDYCDLYTSLMLSDHLNLQLREGVQRVIDEAKLSFDFHAENITDEQALDAFLSSPPFADPRE